MTVSYQIEGMRTQRLRGRPARTGPYADPLNFSLYLRDADDGLVHSLN